MISVYCILKWDPSRWVVSERTPLWEELKRASIRVPVRYSCAVALCIIYTLWLTDWEMNLVRKSPFFCRLKIELPYYLDERCAQQSANAVWMDPQPDLLDYISVHTIFVPLGFIAHNWGYLLRHYSPFLYIFICFSFQFLMLFLARK